MNRLLAVLALLLSACQAPIHTAPSPPDAAAAEQVRAEVARASVDHVAAINRQDLDAFVGSLTEDVVMSLPDGSQLTGRDAVREVAASMFAAGTVSITSETQEILPMGDGFAYRRAAVETRLDGALLDQGIGTYIWAHTPDGWKIARDTWTSAPAASGTP